MNRKTVYATVVGVLLYLALIYIASGQGELTGYQLILILFTPLVMGMISGGAKKGLALGFVVSLIMLTVEVAVLQPGAFANANYVMAVVFLNLPFVLLYARACKHLLPFLKNQNRGEQQLSLFHSIPSNPGKQKMTFNPYDTHLILHTY